MKCSTCCSQVDDFDYHVCIHRYDRFEDFFVYLNRLEAALPEIDIPLLATDGAVTVDLQAVFARAWDAGPYRRRIRYEPERLIPPLDDERRAWLRTVLDADADGAH